jgi:hypothetical protein
MLSGCATRYQPRPGPRISIVMSGGAPKYVRDGQEFTIGPFGGGLTDAVASDPEALEAAETYESRTTTGVILVGVGALCTAAGLVLIISEVNRSPEDRDGARTGLGAGALLCAVGGLLSGSIVAMTAPPYHWDAINIYNDHAEERLLRHYTTPPPGYAPGVVPPGVTPPTGTTPTPAPPPPPPPPQ